MNSSEIVISIFASAFKVVFAIIIVMLVYRGSVGAYEYGQRVFNEPPVSTGGGRSIQVVIPEGSSSRQIGEELEKKGLIRDGQLFMIQEKLSEYKGELLAGTYQLSTSMTMYEMMEIMAEGQAEAAWMQELLPTAKEVNPEELTEDEESEESGS